jgi:hypothetical protein
MQDHGVGERVERRPGAELVAMLHSVVEVGDANEDLLVLRVDLVPAHAELGQPGYHVPSPG